MWTPEEIRLAEIQVSLLLQYLELAKDLSDNPDFLSGIPVAIEYTEHNELGLALEQFCYIICEYDVQIPPDFFNKLAALCSSEELDAYHIDNIRHLVKED